MTVVIRASGPSSRNRNPEAPASGPKSYVEVSTDRIAPNERYAFWRDVALRRMQPVKVFEEGGPFRGKLRRISGNGVELIDHATMALWADRPQSRCNVDACGDISIDVMLSCTQARMSNGRESVVQSGDLCVIDYSRPVHVQRSEHRSLALMLPRARVAAALGEDLATLAGLHLPKTGIGALLRDHLRSVAAEADNLSPAQSALALDVAASLALAALKAATQRDVDADEFADGLYAAARMTIARRCGDPELTPQAVAEAVGCSRASLYRLFGAKGQSVAAAIWEARLKHAHHMLVQGGGDAVTVAEIAFRCGFLDAATFSRMFKRRYGMTPREAREAAARR